MFFPPQRRVGLFNDPSVDEVRDAFFLNLQEFFTHRVDLNTFEETPQSNQEHGWRQQNHRFTEVMSHVKEAECWNFGVARSRCKGCKA